MFDEKIKAIKEEIAECEKNAEVAGQAASKALKANREHRAKEKELQEEISNLQQEIKHTNATYNNKNTEAHNLHQRVVHLQETLGNTEREKAISELEAKQTSFWEALEERLIYQMKELNDGLEGFEDEPKDAKTVVEKIRQMRDAPKLWNPTVGVINQHEQFYTASLRKICEMRIDGKQIPPSEKQARLNVLDRFLFDKAIVSAWS
jgi:chromosome segregation ATPase